MPSYEAVPPQAGGVYSFFLVAGPANVKGAYTQLAASTGSDSAKFWVYLLSQGTNVSYLTDVATGAAASEVVLIADMMTQTGTQSARNIGSSSAQYFADIPASTRIAARMQTNTPFTNFEIAMMLVGDATESLPIPTTYGAIPATSHGTLIDPGAVLNTKGAYVQITASTAALHQFVTTLFGNNQNVSPQLNIWGIDVAVGAAASEVIFLPDIKLIADAFTDQLYPAGTFWHVDDLPASSRLAVRAATNTTNAVDRVFEVVLICGEVPTIVTGGGSVAVF